MSEKSFFPPKTFAEFIKKTLIALARLLSKIVSKQRGARENTETSLALTYKINRKAVKSSFRQNLIKVFYQLKIMLSKMFIYGGIVFVDILETNFTAILL